MISSNMSHSISDNEWVTEQERAFMESGFLDDSHNHILAMKSNHDRSNVFHFTAAVKRNVLIIANRSFGQGLATRLHDYMAQATDYNLIGPALSISEALEFSENHDIDFLINVGYLESPGDFFTQVREKHKNVVTVQYSLLDGFVRNFCRKNDILFQFDTRKSVYHFMQYLIGIQYYCDEPSSGVYRRNTGLTCFFTGHRPQNLSFGFDEYNNNCTLIKKELNALILNAINQGYSNFISPMAFGFDIWAAEAVLEITKQARKNIKLSAIINCKTQPDKWSPASKKRYFNILEQCEETIYMNDELTQNCMKNRIKFTLDRSDLLIALYNGNQGGTEQTISQAVALHKSRIIINPDLVHCI